MDFVALAQECAPQVAHETLAAIVKTESGFRPFAIGVNGGVRLSRQPASKAEAVATAKWLLAEGYNIDLGLGQVNSSNLAKTGLSVEDAFDPCRNLAAAATILKWNYESAKRTVEGEQAALHAALSAYNTGSFSKGFSNGYVQKVVGNAGGQPLVPAVAPIPLAVGKTQAKHERTKAQGAVMIRAESAKPEASETDVYEAGDGSRGVMVYGGDKSAQGIMVY